MSTKRPATFEKGDDRPRHVRVAEQELKKDGRVKHDPDTGRGKVVRNGRTVTTLTKDQYEEVADQLLHEYSDQFVVVRAGLYTSPFGDADDGTDDDAPLTVGDVDAETARAGEILERWPALDEHYADAHSSLYDAGKRGVITRIPAKNGTVSVYVLDEDFYEWLGGRIDVTDTGDADESTDTDEASADTDERADVDVVKVVNTRFVEGTDTGTAPGGQVCEEPDPDDASTESASAEETPDGEPNDKSGDEPGEVEALVEALLDAHGQYVRALTGLRSIANDTDTTSKQDHREELQSRRDDLAGTIQRLAAVYRATRVGADMPTLDDVLDAVTTRSAPSTPRLRANASPETPDDAS